MAEEEKTFFETVDELKELVKEANKQTNNDELREFRNLLKTNHEHMIRALFNEAERKFHNDALFSAQVKLSARELSDIQGIPYQQAIQAALIVLVISDYVGKESKR